MTNNKKIIFFVALLVFFIGSFHFSDTSFFQEALAQDKNMSPTVCIKTQDISFDDITQNDPWILEENLYEIPIGRSAEKMEEIADMIVEEMNVLTDAALAESNAATILRGLIAQCGVDPYICKPHCRYVCTQREIIYSNGECATSCPSYKSGCGPEYCGGGCPIGQSCCCDKEEGDCLAFNCLEDPCTCNGGCIPGTNIACPAGIDTGEISRQAGIIRGSYDRISDPFLKRFLPVTLYKMQYRNNLALSSYITPHVGGIDGALLAARVEGADELSKEFCIDPPSPWSEYCFSPVEFYTCTSPQCNATSDYPGYLEKARQRLVDCAIRKGPTDVSVITVEYSKLFSCRGLMAAEIPIRSFLDLNISHFNDYLLPNSRLFNGCFGNVYCREEGLPIPCSEDFYCCF